MHLKQKLMERCELCEYRGTLPEKFTPWPSRSIKNYSQTMSKAIAYRGRGKAQKRKLEYEDDDGVDGDGNNRKSVSVCSGLWLWEER